MVEILITWFVTALSFLIISKLPIGVEIDSFSKALMSAAVVGILNALLLPILTFFSFPLIILTIGLFLFVLNSMIFGIAAYLVNGFRLRYGFWSALIGSIALAVINSALLRVLAAII
ncbi:membrane protein [Dulcicalothrix desertica PCC 7102]|uniref:Membrane protein n=1 Tax=Dulcicalothrix desertica PCC 7102 TaxID=232991 RepID=A0A3S1CP99_9CYAN|nr:phage holin family protein [Dulcicalothrix desertica]RUT07806.1 membrane protein [Dulcicalothrix desertica PCC 7102]TWH39330.1 putative membrane protein [Dulcicalothrix desertica PCC 7102]